MWFIDTLCVSQCKCGDKMLHRAWIYTKHIRQSANGGFSFYYVMKARRFLSYDKTRSPLLLCWRRKTRWSLPSIFLNIFFIFPERKSWDILRKSFLFPLSTGDVFGICAVCTIWYIFMNPDKYQHIDSIGNIGWWTRWSNIWYLLLSSNAAAMRTMNAS